MFFFLFHYPRRCFRSIYDSIVILKFSHFLFLIDLELFQFYLVFDSFVVDVLVYFFTKFDFVYLNIVNYQNRKEYPNSKLTNPGQSKQRYELCKTQTPYQ